MCQLAGFVTLREGGCDGVTLRLADDGGQHSTTSAGGRHGDVDDRLY